MLISIIIPVKNDADGISRCLKSIAELECNEHVIEIIVIDNGSVDNTVDVVRNFDAKIMIDKNLTVAGLRNLGVSIATGDIIAFIDSDCIADKLWIISAVKHFSDTNIACVGSMAKSLKRTLIEESWNEFRTRRKGIQQVGWINSMNMFVRKDAFNEVGGFNTSLVTCEDVDLCYRLGIKYIILSDDNIIVYHFGEATTIKQFIRKEMWRGYSGFDGMRIHGINRSEIKSLLLPIYYSITLIIVLVFIMVHSNYILIALTLHLLPFVCFLGTRFLDTSTKYAICQTGLFYIYASSRAIAAFRRLYDELG